VALAERIADCQSIKNAAVLHILCKQHVAAGLEREATITASQMSRPWSLARTTAAS
jgi:hypothetical protein